MQALCGKGEAEELGSCLKSYQNRGRRLSLDLGLPF